MSRLVDERYLSIDGWKEGAPTGHTPPAFGDELEIIDVETFDDCPGLKRVHPECDSRTGQELQKIAFSERVFVGAVLVLSCLAFLSLGAILVWVL